MKDRCHDEAMAEMFKEDPAYAVELVNSILDDGDGDDLQIAFRQMDKAGLLTVPACCTRWLVMSLGRSSPTTPKHFPKSAGSWFPMLRPWSGSSPPCVPCGLSATSWTPQNAEAIKAVIRKYGPQARALYKG